MYDATGEWFYTHGLSESCDEPKDSITIYMSPQMQNYYVWATAPYEGASVLDWERPYQAVLYANSVLEGLQTIERTQTNSQQYDFIRGQALFHRSHMFYQLAQVFSPAYNRDGDNAALGIILRLEADISETLSRATVQETYERIISDLSAAIDLLDETPLHKGRPSKQAAYGLLARCTSRCETMTWGFRFKGSYSFQGSAHYFSGLAVDEILLIRAECQARLGNIMEALNDLNTLLVTRWREDSYEPYEVLNANETLSVILEERRKQLLFRGLRWTDLRRLNQEGHDITLVRNINGQAYTLPPNDPRWTWPLPPEVLAR